MSDFPKDDAPGYTSRNQDLREQETEAGERTVFGRTVTINKPRDEIYAFWRDFSNLSKVMENIESITVLDDKRSRWRVKGPTGVYEWISLVTQDEPGRVIAWESEPGADVKNSGRVEFTDARPAERGTWVTAIIGYEPPGGIIGRTIAKLTQREPEIQQRRDLRRLKQLLETGEIPTSTPPNPPPSA